MFKNLIPRTSILRPECSLVIKSYPLSTGMGQSAKRNQVNNSKTAQGSRYTRTEQERFLIAESVEAHVSQRVQLTRRLPQTMQVRRSNYASGGAIRSAQ